MRRLLLGDVPWSLARLAEVTIALFFIIWTLQILGAVGLFSRLPVILGCVVVGAGVAAWCRRREKNGPGVVASAPGEPPVAAPLNAPAVAASPRRGPLARVGRVGWWQIALAALAVAAVAAAWGAAIAPAVNGGPTDPDTLWYHAPLAARFVARGDIVALNFFGPDAQVSFYPATAELLQGFAMLLFGGDVLLAVINFGWLALLVLASWCVGRAVGRPAAAVLAVAVFAGALVLRNQAGGADSDVVALALLMCAVAFVLEWGRERSRGVLWLAAVAAGLAVSAKLTVAAAVLALAVGGVVIARRGARLSAALTWAVGLAAGGAFWFVRNLVATGNPLPWIALGPLRATPLLSQSTSYTVARYVVHGGIGARVFSDGLSLELGSLWPLVLVVALVGALVAVGFARGRPELRLVGFVALVAAGAYLVTPKGAGGALGHPVLFANNLRFGAPALVLGALGLALVAPAVRPGARARWLRGLRALLGAAALALLAVALDYGSISRHPVGALLGAAAVAVAVAAALLARRRRRVLAVALVLAFALPVAVAVAALERHAHYSGSSNPIRAAWAWGASVSHARIALAGSFAQYPFYGATLSNSVQYLGARGPRGSFFPETSCQAWRAALTAGRYDYVAITDVPRSRPAGFTIPEVGWTQTDPAARLVLGSRGEVWIFALHGDGTAAGCELLPPGRPHGFLGL